MNIWCLFDYEESPSWEKPFMKSVFAEIRMTLSELLFFLVTSLPCCYIRKSFLQNRNPTVPDAPEALGCFSGEAEMDTSTRTFRGARGISRL